MVQQLQKRRKGATIMKVWTLFAMSFAILISEATGVVLTIMKLVEASSTGFSNAVSTGDIILIVCCLLVFPMVIGVLILGLSALITKKGLK